jgi:hypothetical protein
MPPVSRVLRPLPALLAAAAIAASAAPAPALRELSTDRPDATEGPYTVDAGRLQLELDGVSYTRDRQDGGRTTEWEFAPFNLRYGLTPRIEAGLLVVPHRRVTEEPRSGPKTTTRGWGDTTFRLKVNLAGNDGGPRAFGAIVDLKLPTAADGLGNDRVEGAITLPAVFELGGGWEGGAMTSLGIAHLGPRGRRPVWFNTVTCGREIAPDTGGFLELTSTTGDGSHAATFNCGVTRRFGPHRQLDAGVNVGISRAAPDLGVFAGLTQRF